MIKKKKLVNLFVGFLLLVVSVGFSDRAVSNPEDILQSSGSIQHGGAPCGSYVVANAKEAPLDLANIWGGQDASPEHLQLFGKLRSHISLYSSRQEQGNLPRIVLISDLGYFRAKFQMAQKLVLSAVTLQQDLKLDQALVLVAREQFRSVRSPEAPEVPIFVGAGSAFLWAAVTWVTAASWFLQRSVDELSRGDFYVWCGFATAGSCWAITSAYRFYSDRSRGNPRRNRHSILDWLGQHLKNKESHTEKQIVFVLVRDKGTKIKQQLLEWGFLLSN